MNLAARVHMYVGNGMILFFWGGRVSQVNIGQYLKAVPLMPDSEGQGIGCSSISFRYRSQHSYISIYMLSLKLYCMQAHAHTHMY